MKAVSVGLLRLAAPGNTYQCWLGLVQNEEKKQQLSNHSKTTEAQRMGNHITCGAEKAPQMRFF
jgi:hypothetical protein